MPGLEGRFVTGIRATGAEVPVATCAPPHPCAMIAPMTIDLQALARLGAHLRLAALVTEMDALVRAFPDLGAAPARPATTRQRRRRSKTSPGATATRGKQPHVAEGAGRVAAGVAAKRGTLSAAGRARIVAAQKKRWAAARAGKKRTA